MNLPRLLFISNLFPDKAEPYRGLDNATILHHLRTEFDITAISPRSALFASPKRQPRDCDLIFNPLYIPTPYVPKIGSLFNHRLMAGALRKPIGYLGRKQPFDIILSSWLYPDSCAVALLGNNIPFVSIAQGSDVHHYLKMPVRRSIIVKEMQRASGIITRSAALARLLAEAGLPNEKLHPVYNGIDFAQFTPADKSAARKALGLPAAASIILFVGNLLPVKNPLLLIQAHAKLRNTHLVMVGGGPMQTDVRSLAASLGTMNRITFAGRRTAGDVARYMQAADALVLPSKNEGVPNVILEAFACGLPVVASRVGGIPEVHHSDFLGQLVIPGNLDSLVNAIERVISVPADRDRIHHHALQFGWEAAAAKYSMLLRGLLRSPKG